MLIGPVPGAWLPPTHDFEYAGKAMDVNVDLKVFDSMLKKLD